MKKRERWKKEGIGYNNAGNAILKNILIFNVLLS